MTDSTSNNEYFLDYGLEKDPFPLNVIDANIYLTPEINRRLKTAKQHIKTSEKLLLISSAPGAGKTLLAQKLVILKEQDWQVSLSIATSDFDPEKLAHSIIQQLLPEVETSSAQSISMMHKYLEQSYQAGKLPVIVIDDADKLSFEALQFIFQLADLRYNDAFFRFVLFANESINELIAKPGLLELSDGTIQSLPMPTFSQDQLRAYLKYRFSSCGDAVELPFTDNDIEFLHKVSGGLPGGINIMARQLMQQKLQKAKPAKRDYSALILLLAVFMAILAGYQYYKNSTMNQLQPPMNTDKQETRIEVISPEKQTLNASDNKPDDNLQSMSAGESSTVYEPLTLKLSDTLSSKPAMVEN